MAAIFSIPGARLARRVGMAKVGAAGTALFALGMLWWLTQLGPVPDYAGEFLPGMLICGIGVGLVIPTITAAAAVVLPPERFATGTGVLTMGRQVGVAIGVAVLVALLGDPKTVGDFDSAYAFMLGMARPPAGSCSRMLGQVEAHRSRAGRRAEVAPSLRPRPRRWRHDRPRAARRASSRERSRRPASPSCSASRSTASRRAASTFAMEPGEEHLNPLGTVHGGLLATMLDSAMGCAVQSVLPAGTSYTTVQLDVKYVRSPPIGEGRIRRRGPGRPRRPADRHRRGPVSTPSGRLCAHATTTCLVLAA